MQRSSRTWQASAVLNMYWQRMCFSSNRRVFCGCIFNVHFSNLILSYAAHADELCTTVAATCLVRLWAMQRMQLVSHICTE